MEISMKMIILFPSNSQKITFLKKKKKSHDFILMSKHWALQGEV